MEGLAVILHFFMALVLVVLMLYAGRILGPRRKSWKKEQSFECGIPEQGSAYVPFRVRYFLVAILFVLFDIEIVFMYPWAVNLKFLSQELGILAFWEMVTFAMTVLLGLGYVIRNGALKWSA